MQLPLLDSDPSTALPEGFRAPTPASPARAPDSPENTPVCGVTLHDWSPSADPLGYSLRMYLASELAALTGCSPIWKRSATPHGRSWWVLTTLGRRTSASESGSWPTATATSKAHPGVSLTDAVVHGLTAQDTADRSRQWATPAAQDHKNDTLPASQAARDTLPGNVLAGLPDPAPTSTNGNRPASSLALNPAFVATLMGYPSDWCRVSVARLLELWETPSSRKSSKQSGGR